MRLDEAIRQRGFRRWYERQLLQGHAHLVTGLLALIMMVVAMEVIPFRQSVGGLLVLLAVGAAGAMICLVTWRKFTFLLSLAEYIAKQASCPSCGVYGKFTVESGDAAPDSVTGCVVHVRCRACGHAWAIA
jgi:hypothetical protein